MDVRFVPLDLWRIDALRCEAIVLPFFSDERPLRGAPGLCDWRLCGRLSALLQRERVTGAFGEVTLVPGRPRLPFDKLLLFGAGASTDFDAVRFDLLTARILVTLDGLLLKNLALALPGRSTGRVSPADAIRWFLSAEIDRHDLDEVIILDELDAQKQMAPVVETERHRMRTARESKDSK